MKPTDNWWLEFIPAANESNQDYVDRMCQGDGYHFVMKEVTNMELLQLAKAYEIAAFRHDFVAGQYVILVIRDLVFCCYGSDFEQAGHASA
jgi:hypothetical protein